MVSTTSLVAGAAIVLATTIALAGASARAQQTSNDGVYTKAQADRAEAQFTKMCAECHPFTEAAKKKPKDVPLGDEPFVKAWDGRTLGEMITTIVLTMPNDGSGVVTDEESVDLVAYILQRNGYPAGSKPLTKADASAVVLKPRK